jgi:PAS domain S-box-containing protein
MDLIENLEFEAISPKIVAVADHDVEAPGLVKAKTKGLYTTRDYNDLFARDDIELIIELTGDMDVYNDILTKKNKSVRAIAHQTALLFWEIARISGQKNQIDNTLEKTRTMYKTAINGLIHEDVLVIASNYQILDINAALLKKIGLKRDEVIGRNCFEITHHYDSPCSDENCPCPLNETIASQKPATATHVHLDKNNRELYMSISCYPLLGKSGVLGAIELSRDITKEINMQKSMMQQEKLASIGRLSAGVAHEINNPLTTILTTTMLLQEELDPADPKYQELETVTKETLRCRKIVTGLLDFARQSKPIKKENDLNQLVKDSIILTKKQAAFKDVTLTFELAEDLPHIFIDKGQIQQSIINLVINAIEATEPGGSISVTTTYQPLQNFVEIAVKDTGTGIAESDTDKIFDPFFTTKDDGSGLGLAITHGIIEQHNGAIDVESQFGRGTTFRIKLPIKSGEEDVA